MATTTFSPSTHAPTAGTVRMIRAVTIWHVAFGVLCVAALVLLQTMTWDRTWLRVLLTTAAGAGIVGNAATVWLLAKQKHAGRALSLLLNYVVLVSCVLVLLHVLGVYVGLDAVAGRFQRAAPILLGAVVGYLCYGFGDRFADNARTQRRIQQVGKWLIIGSLAVTLLAMGLLSGLLFVLQRLADPLALALLLGALVFGAMFWVMLRTDTGLAFGATKRNGEMIDGYLFLAPNVIGFLLFFAGPLLFSLFLSFTDSDIFSAQWIGLRNYLEIFSLDVAQLASANQRASEVLQSGYVELTRFGFFGQNTIIGARDKLFWISLWNTGIYCFWTTVLSVVPALLLANLLNTKVPGLRFFRSIYFLPSIAGVVGVAVVWKLLYNSNVGFLNYGLGGIVDVINVIPGVDIAQPNIAWLVQQDTALLSIIIMSAWQIMGFNIVLFLAGLQTIPTSLYEAATIDGANGRQQFFRLTIPLLAPTTFFVLTTTLIRTLQVFDEVVVMTPPPGGGPNNATLTSVLYLYQSGFQNFQQGYAAAVAWVLFIFIFLITVVQFRLQADPQEA